MENPVYFDVSDRDLAITGFISVLMSLPSGSAGLKLHRDIALHLLSECDQLVFIAGAVSTSFPRIHTSLVHYNKNYKYLSKVKLQHIFLVVSTFFGNRILLCQILKVICP